MIHKAVILLIFISTLFVTSCNNKSKQPINNEVVKADTITTSAELLFGIPKDSFELSTRKVRRNEFMSTILQKYNVDYALIDFVARQYKSVFDVRQIRVGNKYTAFLRKDSTNKLDYFVYEKNLVDYVVYDFSTDTPQVTIKSKPVRVERRHVSGTITSSLWNAMIDNNINPMVALELSDLYAWSIDFFGIAKGDKFKVVYQEAFVDTLSVGIREIEGAVFKHIGQNYYAIPFMQDSVISFYDERGNSLKKAFLKAPLKFSRISSGFTNRRYHPVLKYYRPHHGIDYAAPSGTPVRTIGDGTIIKKAYQRGGGGNYLKIKHNSTYTTTYMHLRGYAKGMYVGKRVKQGDVIGYVGMTGVATGPHLDFRVHKNGSAINPLKVKSPPVKPVKKENMHDFREAKRNVMKELRKLDY